MPEDRARAAHIESSPPPGAAAGRAGPARGLLLGSLVPPVPVDLQNVLRVEALGDERLDLKLAGPLPAGWPGSFARSCATQGVSLVRGDARRYADATWSARLELDLSLVGDVGDVDFLRFGDRSPAIGAPAPRILDFELERSSGGLRVEVHAWDAVGLLAAVIEHVEALGFETAGLVLETEGGLAFHQLEVVPTVPGPDVDERCARLHRTLADFVRPG